MPQKTRQPPVHDRELMQLLAFCAGFAGVSALTYLLPGLELVQPWIVGERLPLVHLVVEESRVVESQPGVLETRRGASVDPEAFAEDAFDTGLLEDAPPLSSDAATRETPAAPEVPEAVAAETPEPAAEEPGAEEPAAEEPAAEPAPEEPAASEPAGPEADPEDAAVAELAVAAPSPVEPAEAPGAPTVAPVEADTRGAQAPPPPRAVASNADRPGEGRLPDRSPAHGTPLEVPPGALDAWFTAMARADAGVPGAVARALHWGDSTIAADGITKTVRSRLQKRFGDAGPGFLAVHVDPRWSMRPSVLRATKGSWKTRTITFGGAGNAHYGLAGTVSTTWGASSSTLGGRKIDGERQPLRVADLSFQLRPGGGTVHITVPDGPTIALPTASETLADAHHRLELPADTRKVIVSTDGSGPVTVYGIALETGEAGVTWETLGVAGSSQASMLRQGANHLARQIAQRDPDLVIYQMGGNELGYPALKASDGGVWRDRYVKVVQRLRAGAPDASCLLITPLDQGQRVRGSIQSKPTLDTMIRLQREVAMELGCAFWDARGAMGGKGAYARWLSHKLAWGDLYHLTNKGLTLIGHSLADAMEAAYEEWRAENPVVASASAG
jgi:lysophospholipase L1-like esterase/outer membrane biosynthesis protein TonB